MIKMIEPFILNRFQSMNHNLIEECEFINKYSFRCDPNIVNGLLELHIPYNKRVFLPYIKEKKELEHEFDFLFSKIKSYYKWGSKELNIHKELILTLINNKDKLMELFRFFGIEEKYYKKYDVEIKVETEVKYW